MYVLVVVFWLFMIILPEARDMKNWYIVQVKAGTAVLSFLSSLKDPSNISTSSLSHIASFPSFSFYTVSFPSESFISHLQAHPAVLSGSLETIFHPSWIQEPQPPVTSDDVPSTFSPARSHLTSKSSFKTHFPAPCALGLLSHRHATCLDKSTYLYSSSASNTYAYVLDSGINIHHSDFEGRAVAGFDATPPPSSQSGEKKNHGAGRDDIGHGTHVAGLIASRTYGVAKRASIISVKVIDSDGVASSSSVISGLGSAVGDILKKKRTGRAVMVMAFNGLKDEAVESAVTDAVEEGISVVLAAGNIDADAGYTSPAGAEGDTIVVSATGKQKRRWGDANWGSGVDIFALGVGVRSLSARGTTGTLTRSGTSQAAALVAGLVLYLKSIEDLPDARATRRKILDLATKGVVKDTKGAKDLFAYNGSGK